MADDMCSSCFDVTKYECLSCKMPFCCKCTTPEEDEDVPGWVMGKAVGYCQGCFEDVKRKESEGSVVEKEIELDIAEEEEGLKDENNNISQEKNEYRKKAGRKATWSSATVNDLVDIITNNEQYKKKLVFINLKNQTNSVVYEGILKELKGRALERGEKINFTVAQIRNKFKKCVAECKKVALTIKTATGIQRFVDEKNYGNWFNQLFPIVKTRDSCQPEMAIEPSKKRSTEEAQEKKQFVPVKQGKKRRSSSLEEASQEMVNMVKEVIANDPTKELIALMKDEMEKQRQHEAQLFSLLTQNAMFNTGAYHQPHGAPTFMPSTQAYNSVPFPSLAPNPEQATMFNQGHRQPGCNNGS